jgi:hypothetical protein
MKILACVSIGEGQAIQEWDFEEHYLIIHLLDFRAIAMPLDKSKIKVTTKTEEIVRTVESAPRGQEYAEAVRDSFERVYLGALKITDAVLLQTGENPN